MPTTFVCSDSHFSHRGIVKFLREDNVTKERPWDTIEEMDEALVKNWNSVVRPTDTVYHLGDVVINRSALPILGRLNGTKILVKGNHDVFRAEEYLEYFKDIRGSAVLNNLVMTHIPLHPASIERWDGNVHGHLHSKRVMTVDYRGGDMFDVIDPRYLCVSMEHINYTPISLEEVMKRFKEQQ
jgi:calcineurin-like phosphoesterase family protein